ncbi:hypothetical protein PR048_027673 [Dryococelus australis]|uniref:Uncharacterized protein n=1 Tax=Dryococelus australis TaxID=614101 RepID=A0ABQ9GH48_9NEOP|nr:hypothetical protein PR048_027673 [Dryococelus australis]
MEHHRNERAVETGDTRENPLTNGIVRHDSHMQKYGQEARERYGDTNTHAQRLIAPTRKACSVSVLTLYCESSMNIRNLMVAVTPGAHDRVAEMPYKVHHNSIRRMVACQRTNCGHFKQTAVYFTCRATEKFRSQLCGPLLALLVSVNSAIRGRHTEIDITRSAYNVDILRSIRRDRYFEVDVVEDHRWYRRDRHSELLSICGRCRQSTSNSGCRKAPLVTLYNLRLHLYMTLTAMSTWDSDHNPRDLKKTLLPRLSCTMILVCDILHRNTSQEEERKIKSIIESLINEADINISDGKINIKTKFNGTAIDDQLYIVPETYESIAGRVWIRKFGLNLCNLDIHDTVVSTVTLIDTFENMDQVAQMYPVLCNGKIGKIPDVVVSLKLRKGAQPVFHRECEVPFALMKKADAELDTLEAEGVLT